MADPIVFALYDSSGVPLAAQTPTFTHYVTKAGVAGTDPTITNLGGGRYGFLPTVADEVAGMCYLIDGGVAAAPRWVYGVIHTQLAPFALFCVFDAAGTALSSGAPTVGQYTDLAAVARSAPTVTQVGAIAYMYTITPSAADLLVGVSFRMDAFAGTTPAYLTGFFSLPSQVPGAVTLSTLRSRVRERADMLTAGFVLDTALSIDAWINEGVQKLHEMLIKAYGEEFLEKSASFTTVAGTSDIALPEDFFVLYGVDLALGGYQRTLMPYNRTERNAHRNLGSVGGCPRYKLSGMQAGGVLRLLPAPSAVYTGTLWYAPSATLLVAVSDTVNFPNGWERFIVVYAAMQMLIKEESDVRELRTELNKMEAELAEVAQRRNADQPHSVVDLDSLGDDDYLYF